MQNSKLVHLLQKLDITHIIRFEEYINTSFFNKNKNLIQLFNFLKPNHPHYKTSTLTKETAFSIIFPKKKGYKASSIRLLMSDLTKLLEEYLVFIKWNKDKIQKKYSLLQVYNELDLERYFWQQHSQLHKSLEQAAIKDIDYYYQQYLLEEQDYQFKLVQKRYSTDVALQNVIDRLDTYYIANKLRYCLAVLNRKGILTGRIESFLFDDIISYLKESKYLEEPLIKAYYHLILLFLHHDLTHLQLLQTILQNSPHLPLFELRQLYTGAINYCNKMVNQGDTSFYQYQFDLYKSMLLYKIIYVGNHLSPNHYHNIVTLGIKLNQIDWTQKFINEYKIKLLPAFKQSAFYYNLARLYFHKQDYDKAQICLLKVEFADPFSHILCKKLLLQTYYEQNETLALNSLVSNFRELLTRSKKLAQNNRTGYRNFVNIAIKLYRIKQGQKKSLTQLLAEVDQLTIVRDKQWLLQKAEELKKIFRT